MNFSMTNRLQKEQLTISQSVRARLVSGMLLSTRQLSYEKGIDQWVDELLNSYVCQSNEIEDFNKELLAFYEFVETNLVGDSDFGIKKSICEDVETTMRAMQFCSKSAINLNIMFRAA